MKCSFFLKRSFTLVIVSTVAMLCVAWSMQEADPVMNDALQNFKSAFNLWQYGIYGDSSAIPPLEGFKREPFPNLVLSVYLRSIFFSSNIHSFSDILDNPQRLLLTLKVNLLWLSLICLSFWSLCRQLFQPRAFADLVAILLTWLSYLFVFRSTIQRLYTELPASALLCLFALSAVISIRSLKPEAFFFSGLIAGLLVLTKASFGYVLAAFIPLLFLSIVIIHGKILTLFVARNFKLFFSLVIGCLAIVSPWTLRNSYHFGTPSVSQGGGSVLLIRAAYDQMTFKEWIGSFYAFSPALMKSSIFEASGFDNSMLQCGGSLERLNRNLPCDKYALESGHYLSVKSFYQKGKRAIPRLIIPREGRSPLKSEMRKREVAISMIRENISRHLLVSSSFLWRGIWSFKSDGWLTVILNLFSFLSLALLPVLSFYFRRLDWFVVATPSLLLFLFYGLATHFIPRYSQPLIPIALLSLAIVVGVSIPRLRSHLKPFSC